MTDFKPGDRVHFIWRVRNHGEDRIGTVRSYESSDGFIVVTTDTYHTTHSIAAESATLIPNSRAVTYPDVVPGDGLL